MLPRLGWGDLDETFIIRYTPVDYRGCRGKKKSVMAESSLFESREVINVDDEI